MLIAGIDLHAEKKYLLDVIPEFFARDPEQGPRNCSRAAGRIDFLHAPLFATHGDVCPAVPTLQRYVTQHLQTKPLYVPPMLLVLKVQFANLAPRRPVDQQTLRQQMSL
jgi:hypothetical protein